MNTVRTAGDAPVLDGKMLGDRLELVARGSWTAAHVQVLEQQVNAAAAEVGKARATSIDMAGVHELDTLGAWLLERLIRNGGEAGRTAEFVGLPGHFRGLLDEVHQVNR